MDSIAVGTVSGECFIYDIHMTTYSTKIAAGFSPEFYLFPIPLTLILVEKLRFSHVLHAFSLTTSVVEKKIDLKMMATSLMPIDGGLIVYGTDAGTFFVMGAEDGEIFATYGVPPEFDSPANDVDDTNSRTTTGSRVTVDGSDSGIFKSLLTSSSKLNQPKRVSRRGTELGLSRVFGSHKDEHAPEDEISGPGKVKSIHVLDEFKLVVGYDNGVVVWKPKEESSGDAEVKA